MLDLMQKGTRLGGVSAYLQAAAEAEISTRATMIVGYPGETARDVRASANFVEAHRDVIERIKLNNFTRTIGTTIDRRLRRSEPERSDSSSSIGRFDRSSFGDPRRPEVAKVDYRVPDSSAPEYRRAMTQLIESVHKVNRQPLRKRAAVFEGVM